MREDLADRVLNGRKEPFENVVDCGQAVLHLIFVMLAHYLLMNDLEVVVVVFKA